MRRIYNPMQYEFLKDQQHWNVLITYSALALGIAQSRSSSTSSGRSSPASRRR